MMNWSKAVRQFHRWVSIAFTLAVLVNGVAVAQGEYDPNMGLLAVLPLGLLLLTGLYMFMLPHAAKLRARRHSTRQAS